MASQAPSCKRRYENCRPFVSPHQRVAEGPPAQEDGSLARGAALIWNEGINTWIESLEIRGATCPEASCVRLSFSLSLSRARALSQQMYSLPHAPQNRHDQL